MKNLTKYAKGIIIAIMGLFLYSGATNAQIPNPLRIATEGAYPPFNMKNAAGELTGFDVEIAHALCEKMNVTCTLVSQDWDGIIPALLARKYDAIIASMSITEERLRTVEFSEPYYSNSLQLAVADSSKANSIDDLKGENIGAQRATVAAQWLEDNFMNSISIRLYDTQTAAYSDLQSGRLAGIVSDILPLYEWVNSTAGFSFRGDKIDIDDQIGIAVRKSDTALRDAFSKAIREIRDDGTYARINANYFPFDIY